MENLRLYLVGTHHEDIDGETRLDDLLARFLPDVIALEMAENRLSSLDTKFDEFRKKVEEAFSRAKLNAPESIYHVLLNPAI